MPTLHYTPHVMQIFKNTYLNSHIKWLYLIDSKQQLSVLHHTEVLKNSVFSIYSKKNYF